MAVPAKVAFHLIVPAMLLFTALAGCTLRQPLPMVSDSPQCRKIAVGPGPEDFVIDEWHGEPRFLISCHERRKPGVNGAIWFLDVRTGKAGILRRAGEPDHLVAFKPHGIDIVHVNGKTLLYAVLHDPYGHGQRLENAVGVYEVENDSLRMVAFMEDPEHLWSPNDLSALETGEIYLTNDGRGRLDLYLRRNASEIAYYNPGTGKWQVVAGGLAYANGILAEKDRVFVTATLSNQVVVYPRNPDGTLGEAKELAELKGGDNLTRSGRFLFTTAHYDDFAFLAHAKNPEKKSPSVVMRIDPELGDLKPIYADSGETISAASTAWIYNGKLYISQVFDPFIVVCDVPADLEW